MAIILIVLGIFAFIGLVGGVLAVHGVRSYLTSAKGAEATNTIGELQMRAAEAYEREERIDGPALLAPGSAPPAHRLCPSATRFVPASLSAVAGKKYMSSSTDWETDRAANAGFYCLRFSMGGPQYFQYGYAATPKHFTLTAHGDLDGDGIPSTFEAESDIDSASDTVRPTGQLKVTNKDE